MAVKKKEIGTIVKKNVNGTFLDIRQVPTYSGYGKERRVTESHYAIFHAKKNVKDDFKNTSDAEEYIKSFFHKYNLKKRIFV